VEGAEKPMMDRMFTSTPVAPFDRLQAVELALVVLAAALLFLSVPWTLGRIGLGWDSLNHHFYLGWSAENNRFGRDYLAAGGQATQFPYLYWPVYRLAAAGVSGVAAGSVLALLHVLAVPPVWWLARSVLPQGGLSGAALRVAAVALGLMSAVPLKTLESTGNDFLAAIPVLWAIAVAIHVATVSANFETRRRWAAVAGALGGVAIACKFSNGPMVVLLPIVFLFAPDALAARVKLALLCVFGIGAGFVLSYGYWGSQLWHAFGNPFFPFGDGWFAPVRDALGWQP
jgi:hypothetical protein